MKPQFKIIHKTLSKIPLKERHFLEANVNSFFCDERLNKEKYMENFLKITRKYEIPYTMDELHNFYQNRYLEI